MGGTRLGCGGLGLLGRFLWGRKGKLVARKLPRKLPRKLRWRVPRELPGPQLLGGMLRHDGHGSFQGCCCVRFEGSC